MAKSRTCFVHIALIVFALVVSSYVQAAAPPLKVDEEVVKTKDGCGFVIDNTQPSAKYQRDALAKLTWGGACIEGLAMGEGIVSPGFSFPGQSAMLPVTATVWYGRIFGPMETRWDNGRVQRNFVWEGRNVFYRTLDIAAPVWSKEHSERSLVSDGETMIMTMLITSPIVHVNDLKNNKSQEYPCPNASVKGCEALWAQHAGPVIERIKAFLAENEPKAKARMAEVQTSVTQWKAKQPAGTVEKKQAAAKRAAEEENARTARRLKWEQECWDEDNKLMTEWIGWKGLRYQGEQRIGRALKELYEGSCANHPNAKNGLERANTHLRDAAAHKAEDEKYAKDVAAQNEQAKPEQDGESGWALIGKMAGAAATATNSKDRKQAMLDVLAKPGSGEASSGGNVAGTSSTGSGTTQASVITSDGAGVPAALQPDASVAAAVKAMKDFPDPGRTACGSMIDKWTELQRPTAAQDYERLSYIKYPGTNTWFEATKARFDITVIRACAKDESEYQEQSRFTRERLARAEERLADSRCRDSSWCRKPEGFDEWFARYQRDARIALAWAKSAKPPAPLTAAEKECQAEISRLDVLKRMEEPSVPKDSVVRLSELNLWYMAQVMDTIQKTCPNSARFRSDYEIARKTYPEMLRACNGMASSPPCQPRLKPEAKPVATPSPQPAAPLPSQPAKSSCGESGGASWTKCMVDACRAQGGTPKTGTCVACTGIPGRNWTQCPAGSGGASSMQ